MSGGVYTDKKEHWDFISSTMRENIESNPLHFVEFAHVGQLDAEVIKMTLDAFHGPEGSCGVTSSGGTESIFLAMLAYREEGRKRGISKPNVVAPFTAHAAFDKASFYLGIELRKVKIGKDLKIDARNMKK
jgi:sphinganine-1-phosphate aldolase